MKWGHEDATEVEQQAIPIPSINEVRKQFRALPSTAPFLLFINAETGIVQVAQQLVSTHLQ
jgi:hypothetical protein